MPPSYYPAVADHLVAAGATSGLLVEVGTALGGLASLLMERLPDMKYTAVDPFLADYDAE